MTSRSHQKNQQRKYIFYILFAGLAAALTGKYVAPVLLPQVQPYLNEETVFFGQTLAQADVAMLLSYGVVFLPALLIVSCVMQDKGGNTRPPLWLSLGVIIIVGAGSWVVLHKLQTISAPPGKTEPVYKDEDRHKLEQLIHEGTKHD